MECRRRTHRYGTSMLVLRDDGYRQPYLRVLAYGYSMKESNQKNRVCHLGDSVSLLLHMMLTFRVDLEAYAELVRDNAITRAEVGFLQRHNDRAAFLQSFKQLLGLIG